VKKEKLKQVSIKDLVNVVGGYVLETKAPPGGDGPVKTGKAYEDGKTKVAPYESGA
jgi:hypothetical protein